MRLCEHQLYQTSAMATSESLHTILPTVSRSLLRASSSLLATGNRRQVSSCIILLRLLCFCSSILCASGLNGFFHVFDDRNTYTVGYSHRRVLNYRTERLLHSSTGRYKTLHQSLSSELSDIFKDANRDFMPLNNTQSELREVIAFCLHRYQ